jgi:predicted aspartyl protease
MPLPARSELRVTVRLFSNDLSREENLELQVDATSLYSWIPADVGTRIGVMFPTRRRFRLAGTIIERTVGDMRIELEGRRGTAFVVLAEPGDRVVLGELALTCLGLEVDPRTNRIRDIERYLALATAG